MTAQPDQQGHVAADTTAGQPPILRALITEAHGWFHHDTQENTMTTPAPGILITARVAADQAASVLELARQIDGDKLTQAAIAAREAGVDQAVRDAFADAIAKLAPQAAQ